MAIRTSTSLLLSGTALDGALRASTNLLLSAIPFSGPKYISTHALISGIPFAGPKKITAHYLVSAITIRTSFTLNLLENTRFLYGVDNYTYELHAQPMPEHNPYRPRIPEQLIKLGDDYYDFAEENQQILREQHNITQAGDTTFPYQLVIQTHDDKLYKLGSIGRFYHEDYGVSLCRYVQFDEMITVDTPSCPVGLFKKASSLEWKVTNDYSKSDPNLVVGISSAYTLPKNKQYGWVVIDGSTLQPLKNTSETVDLGESFAWSASGEVNNSASGKTIGHRVNKLESGSNAILAGQMWIRLGSLSKGSVTDLIDERLQTVLQTLQDLTDNIGDLPTRAEFTTITNRLTVISGQLTSEISARLAADLAMQDLIANLDGLSQTDLDNAMTLVSNNLEAAVNAINVQITEVRGIALEALEKANEALAGDLTSLQDQLNTIRDVLNAEIRKPKGRFPVVDGSVPPNLVYAEDGSLIYLETF